MAPEGYPWLPQTYVLHELSSHASSLPTHTIVNVQVATDTRLWLYNQLLVVRQELHDLIRVAADRSAAEVDVLMPGGLACVWVKGPVDGQANSNVLLLGLGLHCNFCGQEHGWG